MTKDIYIITYCDDIDLLGGSTLVFKTLRVGFPNARVTVYFAGELKEAREEVKKLCKQTGCIFKESETIKLNHQFVEYLVSNLHNDFILLDSDIVFWQNCEDFEPQRLIAGRLIPRHYDNYTECVTWPRLHTSFMYFKNAYYIRQALAVAYGSVQGATKRFTPVNPFYPFVFSAHNNEGEPVKHFYDTCCNLYQTLGGEAFGEDMLNRFDHLNCSSYVKAVESECAEVFAGFTQRHKEIYNKPELLKGIWRKQDEYYRKYAI